MHVHSFSHTRLMGLLKWYQSILQAAAWYQGHQHFTFHSAHPGKVFVHLTLDSTETVFNMMTTEVSALPTTTSVTVPAPGMSDSGTCMTSSKSLCQMHRKTNQQQTTTALPLHLWCRLSYQNHTTPTRRYACIHLKQ